MWGKGCLQATLLQRGRDGVEAEMSELGIHSLGGFFVFFFCLGVEMSHAVSADSSLMGQTKL